jgi:hypothetical protein
MRQPHRPGGTCTVTEPRIAVSAEQLDRTCAAPEPGVAVSAEQPSRTRAAAESGIALSPISAFCFDAIMGAMIR